MGLDKFVRDAVLASLRNEQKLTENADLANQSHSEEAEKIPDATKKPVNLKHTSNNANKTKLDGLEELQSEMSTAKQSNDLQTELDKVPSGTRKSKKRKASITADMNWKVLQKQLMAGKKPRRNDDRKLALGENSKYFNRTNPKHATVITKTSSVAEDVDEKKDSPSYSAFMKRAVRFDAQLTKIVGMDCEMVGVGPDGHNDALARVSVVNYFGDVLYDTFVRPGEEVTDYRTKWSGVRETDIGPESTAVTAYEAQRVVGELLKNRIVVGHSLKNDFRVLRIAHPWNLVRDTSNYYKKKWRRPGNSRPALRHVVAQVLGVDTFQKSEHDSCEDARAALALYKKNAKEWERSVHRSAASRKGKSILNTQT